MTTTAQDHSYKIAEINDAISKLEKTHQKAENDPRLEEQIKYYKLQIESSSSKLENKEKLLNAKLEAYQEKIELEIENMKKALNAKLEAYTAKIENEIQSLKDKHDEYTNFCNTNIQQRENPSNKLYTLQKEELLKQRHYYIFAQKEAEEMEQSIKKQIQAMEDRKKRKPIYTYNGKEYNSDKEMYSVIHREIEKARILSQETDSESED